MTTKDQSEWQISATKSLCLANKFIFPAYISIDKVTMFSVKLDWHIFFERFWSPKSNATFDLTLKRLLDHLTDPLMVKFKPLNAPVQRKMYIFRLYLP